MAWLFLRGKDLESAAGTELLALCQGVTADGVLSDEEIGALGEWLSRHENTAIAGAEHLRGVVTQVLADGKITEDERRTLQSAVEAVLPPEYRQTAIQKRREARKAEQERARAEREAAKHEEHRNHPVATLDFMVAGVAFEGRASVVRRFVRQGDDAFLQRDHGNRHSRNAVRVLENGGRQIGFVPEDDAAYIAPLLDGEHKHAAEIKKVLDRGRYPIPVVVAWVFRPDATLDGLLSDAEVAQRIGRPLPTAARLGRLLSSPGIWIWISLGLIALVLVASQL